MTRSPLHRRAALPAALALAAVIVTGCSGADPEPTPAPTATSSTTTASPTQTPTETASESPTADPTQSPTTPAPGGTQTPLGTDAAALAQLLPLGFPIPPELTILGDPTSTDDNANVTFTVPSGAEAFDFYMAELPEAGFEMLPGTSDIYSTEVASAAIIARSSDFNLNMLIVEDDVELTLTRTQ